MRRRCHWPVLVLILGLSGTNDSAVAQLQTATPAFPPAGYPLRAPQPLSGLQVGPSWGLAAPGVSTLPSTSSPAVAGVRPTPAARPTTNPRSASSYPGRQWSPRTAVWDIQEQLRRVTPLPAGGQRTQADGQSAPRITSEPASGFSPNYGMAGSQLGLDTLARYRGLGNFPLPAASAPPAEPAPAATQDSSAPIQNDLGVPFEQFESYEEFRAWLTEQLKQPDGGAVGQALARLEDPDQSPTATTDQRTERGQSPYRSIPQAERPPIGYVGIGSNARTPIGMTRFGPDAAFESARVAAELNEYLRSSRQSRLPRQPVHAESSGRQSAGQITLPPPRSNLGRRFDGSGRLQAGYSSAPSLQGYAPQTQLRNYYQNLGGYQPPQPGLDWPAPGVGY